ncbi:mediator of RNA polymerase II transcription subunit 24-like [Ruditapes philippinarum]|uniref:mediator of RNA polymerase II transcription subunit 24-like n=1 Tax=Ruditapes philippinarum TaxID=129788 RepID=UPI00295B3E75|nr:mediator of RNA polymerase II transcription subunit 24-like [Ruditapes philippinarum]
MDSGSGQSGRQDNVLVQKVKGLLMRAWRERWNEIQWGIHLKKLIGTAQPGADTKEIAVLLLQQALVGAHPNSLILSYVKHAVFTKLIPSVAAFKYIYSYDDYNKPHCLLALIEMAKHFSLHMSYSSVSEGGVTLCQTLQALVHWLLKVMLKCVQQYQESRQTEYQNVLHAAALAADAITDSYTVNGLLYIAQSEETEVFCDMEQTELNVRGTLSQIPQDAISEDVRQDVSNLNFLKNIKSTVMPPDTLLDVGHLPICPTIVTMVALEAVLNPTSDMQPFVEQLFVLEKLMKLQRPYLFCELFRACFMGLIDLKSGESQEQYRWLAFSFLKMPQILQKIQQQQPSRDFSSDLEEGFNKLLYSSNMLDLADIKHNCDLLFFLLGECSKINLISESQQKHIQVKRNRDSQKPRPNDQQTCAALIIRAETTFNSILKTLDADYSKNQESLFGVLHHMLSGKNFGLILAAAAATGKLQIFCFKLIKISEFARQSPGEGGKASQFRAWLFDISFLMLCHITQVYGTEMIMSSAECMDTFFVQWALKCFPEDGKYKSVDNSMPVDTAKVDFLLNALTQGTDLSQGAPKWHEICTNIPWAIQEVLFAWEHGSIASDSIKMILGYVKNRMLCLPIVVSAWLCSYINMLSDDARTKPLSMLQQLIQPLTGENTPQYYSERSHLMHLIVQKMIHEILPPSKRPPTPQYIPANTLPAEVMAKTMKGLFSKGWMDMECLRTLEVILNLCGSDWFADRLVMHMLDSYRVEDMSLNLSLVLAVSHMDLEHITLSLLLHTIPGLLLSADKHVQLTDPKGYTLAKYCVLAVTSAQTAKSSQKAETSTMYSRGRKRSRKEFDLDDLDDTHPQKRSKTMEPQITLDSEGFNFDFLNVKEDGDSSPIIDTKDPLNKALLNLFRLMNAIVHDGNVSPKTSFVISFIDEAIRCGQYSRYILQFMPPNMLCQILKCIPGVFGNEKILQICDLTNSTGRKIAAKAICQSSRFEKD